MSDLGFLTLEGRKVLMRRGVGVDRFVVIEMRRDRVVACDLFSSLGVN